jgi:hypothetical protein
MVERRVVLSGVPGSGKTPLLHLLLNEFPGAETLGYDRLHPGMSRQRVEDWLRRGGDSNEMALDNLVAALKDLTRLGAGDGSRSPILFESGFGRVRRATGAFIDFRCGSTPLSVSPYRAPFGCSCATPNSTLCQQRPPRSFRSRCHFKCLGMRPIARDRTLDTPGRSVDDEET